LNMQPYKDRNGNPYEAHGADHGAGHAAEKGAH
jgi:hypothetical protein